MEDQQLILNRYQLEKHSFHISKVKNDSEIQGQDSRPNLALVLPYFSGEYFKCRTGTKNEFVESARPILLS